MACCMLSSSLAFLFLSPFFLSVILSFSPTHSSVWDGCLSVVFLVVRYAHSRNLVLAAFRSKRFNRSLTVYPFVSRFLSMLRTHQTQQSTSSPKPDTGTVTSPMTQKRVTRKSADFYTYVHLYLL